MLFKLLLPVASFKFRHTVLFNLAMLTFNKQLLCDFIAEFYAIPCEPKRLLLPTF